MIEIEEIDIMENMINNNNSSHRHVVHRDPPQIETTRSPAAVAGVHRVAHHTIIVEENGVIQHHLAKIDEVQLGVAEVVVALVIIIHPS